MRNRTVATTRTKKILCVTDDDHESVEMPLPDWCEAIKVRSEDLLDAISEDYHGLLFLTGPDENQRQYFHFGQMGEILDQMPNGVALTDCHNKIVWANRRLAEWFPAEPMVGLNFFEALNRPSILGDSGSPLATALRTGKPTTTTLQTSESRYFRLQAAPLLKRDGAPQHNIVTLSDVSGETLQLQKLEAIHNAGAELADLTPEEVCRMNIEERIELLKANILHYTQDLLRFDVVELRLIDRKTNRAEPLLSVGIDAQASKRPLYALAQDNGVTGFVCATGKSYLCEDTTNDPLYVDGLIGAKSSLTVPLMLHDEVIGSFNVESPQVGAFAESDVQLLETFSRDIARALNSLELLVAQKTNSAQQSMEAIDLAVAQPIDEILNDTVHVIENFIGHDPDIQRRLRSILKRSRDIKNLIHAMRAEMTPVGSATDGIQPAQNPKLRDARILVIDADDEVRKSAHVLLEGQGCIVETAREGREAILMVRNCDPEDSYDAIIADIRLSDLTGYELLTQLKQIMSEPPLVLMTGFGYDPGHSIVKARQAGLKPHAVLYKPFRLDQLLETIEKMLSPEVID